MEEIKKAAQALLDALETITKDFNDSYNFYEGWIPVELIEKLDDLSR
jgi:hypothetical protein